MYFMALLYNLKMAQTMENKYIIVDFSNLLCYNNVGDLYEDKTHRPQRYKRGFSAPQS